MFKGKVELFQGELLNKNVLMNITEKGSYFGEICFFSGDTRTLSAISNGITVLIMLERDKFIEIL